MKVLQQKIAFCKYFFKSKKMGKGWRGKSGKKKEEENEKQRKCAAENISFPVFFFYLNTI